MGAVGGPAGSARAEADRYPADFPTQVFMSSAQAAWQQPAQAAPAGNWPRIAEPAEPPSPHEPAGPPKRQPPPGPPGPRPAPAPARPAGPRHATAGPAGERNGWGQNPADGPGGYPAANGRRMAAEYPAPFPPAPDPAELYPAVHGSARPAGRTPARSRPAASKSRGLRGGLLIGAACLAVLVAVALILFVLLPS
jgi:translation initiation factor IF-2